MHQTRLPDTVRQAARARRGREPGVLEPARTALLVIDMQNAFLAPGAPLETPAARSIVDNINRLAAAMRQAGGRVVWITTTLAPAGSARDWIYLTDFVGGDRRETIRAALRPGSDHHRLWPGLEARDGDLACVKDRFSPFSPGASDLDAMLRGAGIDHLVIAGTLTDVCCECTARDAMMLNYRVTVVEDANAAGTDEDHLRGLTTVARLFADVATTDEVVARLGGV
ncbi:MAG: hydrolase [Alphaproteobacteria bacterium]|nr:MAG: hydrolase [Alphaproteobacteria bacterium]